LFHDGVAAHGFGLSASRFAPALGFQRFDASGTPLEEVAVSDRFHTTGIFTTSSDVRHRQRDFLVLLYQKGSGALNAYRHYLDRLFSPRSVPTCGHSVPKTNAGSNTAHRQMRH
jgi:hypothetical protein